jgi:nucleoside-diphosphate-sugar epimerase
MARELDLNLARWGIVAVSPCYVGEPAYQGSSLPEIDATNRNALRNWIDATHPDLVIHAAALVGSERGNTMRRESVSSNLDTTVAVLDVCEEYRLPLVYISSSAVYAEWAQKPLTEDSPLEPMNFYNVTKLAGELLVRGQANVPWLVLRPAMSFGNFGPQSVGYAHSTLDKLMKTTLYGYSDQFKVALNPIFRKPYVHMSELTAAMAELIRAFPAGEVINVASRHAPQFGDILDVLGYTPTLFPEHITWKPEEDFLQHHVFEQTKLKKYVSDWNPTPAIKVIQQALDAAGGN